MQDMFIICQIKSLTSNTGQRSGQKDSSLTAGLCLDTVSEGHSRHVDRWRLTLGACCCAGSAVWSSPDPTAGTAEWSRCHWESRTWRPSGQDEPERTNPERQNLSKRGLKEETKVKVRKEYKWIYIKCGVTAEEKSNGFEMNRKIRW